MLIKNGLIVGHDRSFEADILIGNGKISKIGEDLSCQDAEIIDAKGLACPEPVLLTKRALDACNEVTVLVDNIAASENIKRFASKSGCVVCTVEAAGAIFRLSIKKSHLR